MKHRSTRDAVEDLRKGGYLIQIDEEVDAHLEMAEIQRRVYANQGPALLFTNLSGCRFPALSNLFRSIEQARYLFRRILEAVRRLIEVKIDTSALPKRPFRYAGVPRIALNMLPRKVARGPVQNSTCTIADLPAIKCWPDDGGAFVTLPQVLSDHPNTPANLMQVNLGMYRVQLSGNEHETNREVGLHYQIHRGMGVHHRAALDRGKPLRVAITVGGSPAMSVAAVMPLPEGLTELTFGGALAGRRIPMITGNHAPVYAEADFAIMGAINPNQTKPEGPYGDHHGYYSLEHEFPVMQVEHVWHRKDAIWPFTVVGRPPQEDTTFGQLIHDLTDPIIPSVIPGVKAVHAVDAAGVHPLLLAIGNELDIHDIEAYLHHLLSRVDWKRDLHFQTQTTIDTLDYSGRGFNQGSKVVIAATGPPQRALATDLPRDLTLPDGFSNPQLVGPGIIAIEAPHFTNAESSKDLQSFVKNMANGPSLETVPIITLVDDSDFAARSMSNWLWTTFTRSNPACDVDGIGAKSVNKHWGCSGSLMIDARIKPHHAPPLIEDPKATAKVDARATRGGELAKYP